MVGSGAIYWFPLNTRKPTFKSLNVGFRYVTPHGINLAYLIFPMKYFPRLIQLHACT